MTIIDVKSFTLSNGIHVLYEKLDHIRSISFKVHVSVGTRNELEDEHGMAHFLEHMLFKATEKRNSFQIANDIERYGGNFNAYTSKEETVFYFSVVDDYFEIALDVFSDMFLFSKFDDLDIKHEKTVVLEEIKSSIDSPDDIIWDYFTENLLKGNSVGRRTLGTLSSVRTFTKEQVQKFYKRLYNAQNITIAAVGNIDESIFKDQLEKHFSAIPSGLKKENEYQSNGKSFNKQYKREISQSHILLGNEVCSHTDSDRYALILLNNILGSGMSSRMFQNIREKYGFAYTVYSAMDFYTDHGIFYNYVATDLKHIDRCIELVKKEIESFRKGKITEREIEDAKLQLKGHLLLSMESPMRRLDRVLRQFLLYGRTLSTDEILHHFMTLDKNQLTMMSEKYFHLSDMSSVIITSKSA
jgi:predicted Zn-dependent peptidase